jgi:plastocyanin domain-containing protein
MLSKKTILGNFVGLGFLLGFSSGVALAQMPHEMPASSSEPTTQFRRIEQPLELKAGVTIGGIALIGLELWWFLFSKTKAPQAENKRQTSRGDGAQGGKSHT